MYVVKTEDTFDILRKVVKGAKCKSGWSFRLHNEDGALRLVIQIASEDNYHPGRAWTVDHYHPVPIATYNEKTWRRWVFEKCLATMNHELGEALRFGPDEVRPFVPMHGPGEDPYTIHEWRSEEDARTTQSGDQRKGSV